MEVVFNFVAKAILFLCFFSVLLYIPTYSFIFMARRAIPMIAFHGGESMFVALTRVCVVYVVKEVTSFRGLGQLMAWRVKERTLKLYRPAERKLCSLRRNWN